HALCYPYADPFGAMISSQSHRLPAVIHCCCASGRISLRKGIFPPRSPVIRLRTFRSVVQTRKSNGGRRMSEELNNRPHGPPVFSSPDNHGVMRDGFIPWPWGVPSAVHPEFLLPIKWGRKSRLPVSVLHRVANAQDPGSADLYGRAPPIANGRA